MLFFFLELDTEAAPPTTLIVSLHPSSPLTVESCLHLVSQSPSPHDVLQSFCLLVLPPIILADFSILESSNFLNKSLFKLFSLKYNLTPQKIVVSLH